MSLVEQIKAISISRLISQMSSKSTIRSIHDAEFQVFSQWGDDGIIQYLVNSIDIENKYFIEFGVENYLESNTRFLLMNNNWSGLVMDSSSKNIEFIQKDEIYWRHDLIAKAAFVSAENINTLIEEEGISGEIGLLHIDIDGNDYWIWKGITTISPDIAIIEYNSVFGKDRAITIPYDPNFNRTKAHYSNLFAGASLAALCDLADEKGYFFIGSNSAGNNAYFVKKEKIGPLKPLSVEEGYVESKFRESRDKEGKLTFIRGDERLKLLQNEGLEVFNTRTGKMEKL